MTITYSAKFSKDTSDKDSLNTSVELHTRLTDNDTDVEDFLAVVVLHRKRAGIEDDGTHTAAMQLVHVEALDGPDAEAAQRVLDRRYRQRMGRPNVTDQTLTGWDDLFDPEPDEGALLLAELTAKRRELAAEQREREAVVDEAGAMFLIGADAKSGGVLAAGTEESDDDRPENPDATAEQDADEITEMVDDAATDREERTATADVRHRLHAVPDAGFSHPEPEWDMAADLDFGRASTP